MNAIKEFVEKIKHNVSPVNSNTVVLSPIGADKEITINAAVHAELKAIHHKNKGLPISFELNKKGKPCEFIADVFETIADKVEDESGVFSLIDIYSASIQILQNIMNFDMELGLTDRPSGKMNDVMIKMTNNTSLTYYALVERADDVTPVTDEPEEPSDEDCLIGRNIKADISFGDGRTVEFYFHYNEPVLKIRDDVIKTISEMFEYLPEPERRVLALDVTTPLIGAGLLAKYHEGEYVRTYGGFRDKPHNYGMTVTVSANEYTEAEAFKHAKSVLLKLRGLRDNGTKPVCVSIAVKRPDVEGGLGYHEYEEDVELVGLLKRVTSNLFVCCEFDEVFLRNAKVIIGEICSRVVAVENINILDLSYPVANYALKLDDKRTLVITFN